MSAAEQMYLPLAFGYSNRYICAVAISSMCTKGVEAENANIFSSPAQIDHNKQISSSFCTKKLSCISGYRANSIVTESISIH